MIDEALLKQLGWSDDLIAHCRTMADTLSGGDISQIEPAEALGDSAVESVTSLGYSPDSRVSGNGMFVCGGLAVRSGPLP